MVRLLSMLGHQYALTILLGTFAGMSAYAMQSWEAAKLLLTLAFGLGILGGTALGWVRGGPPPAAARSALRGIGGAALGLFVFADVGLAVGLVAGYFVGGSAVFETIVPACGTVGALLGLGLGYVLAR